MDKRTYRQTSVEYVYGESNVNRIWISRTVPMSFEELLETLLHEVCAASGAHNMGNVCHVWTWSISRRRSTRSEVVKVSAVGRLPPSEVARAHAARHPAFFA